MVTSCKLCKNDESLEVDHTMHRSIIGSFVYVTNTRPYVMQSIRLVSIFQSSPKETHVASVKIIFRYLKGTMEYGLWYPKGNDYSLKAYTDAYWA